MPIRLILFDIFKGLNNFFFSISTYPYMINDAARYLTRKIKKLDYINTRLPQDYEAINAEYKRLRNGIKLLSAAAESLETYEYGGTIMKNFNDAADKISSALSVKLSREDTNLYIQSAKIGEHLANTTHNSSTKHIGTSFAQANEKIADYKKKMNEELKKIQASLKVLKEQSKAIDNNRRKAEQLRYDLEESLQEEATKQVTDPIQTEFDSKAEEALRGMKIFMGDVGLAGIIRKISNAHREFLESSAKVLESVK